MKKVILDIETTGLSSEVHEILTIGLIVIDISNESLKYLDTIHIKCKVNGQNAELAALSVNNIDITKHNEEAYSKELVVQIMCDFIEKNDLKYAPVIGHNVIFDLCFINKFFYNVNKKNPLHYLHIDTMSFWLVLKDLGIIPEHLKSSLKVISSYFGIDYANAHDAIEDCKITAEVYYRMLKLYKNGRQ